MLYRKLYDKLCLWKESQRKRAICLVGARQVGKTTLVRKFAKDHYPYFAELNFAADPKAADIFSGSLDAETLIMNLTAYIQKPLVSGKSLIFFDEIQECPEIRTAIKFLVEDGRYDYIESGSMLGLRYKEIRSYPVGFEEILTLYPMDFTEFIAANGIQASTLNYLENCYQKAQPVSDSIHQTMIKLFYSYLVVGGMPEAVQIYVNTHDIGQVVAFQREILELYRLDIAKYSDQDKVKIRAVFDAIPAQLNEENRRFILADIDQHGRSRRYESSFLWLSDAAVALPCYNVSEPRLPLQLNQKMNLFKLYMNDVGLLCAAAMENIQFDLLQGNVQINMGSILENAVAQLLKSNGFELNYFSSKRYGELDFVVQQGLRCLLIEVKSGNDYKRHRTLDKIRQVNEWKSQQAYVFCKGNIEKRGELSYLPWYMLMFLTQDKLPFGLLHELDLSGLNPEN